MYRTLRACAAAALALTCAVCLGAAAPPAATPEEPCIDQSPRRLQQEDIRYESKTSIVTPGPGPEDTLFYTPRASGLPTKLYRCGQHYHCLIENFQGCPGQVPTTDPPQTCPEHLPGPGAWIEIHTVYAAEVVTDRPCDPETLACCKALPAVVMAYQARVLPSPELGVVAPVPVLWGFPAVEWSGSNTGWDPVGACKPVPAQWSFILGCNFTLTENQLKVFRHADAARRLQPPARLSNDLTLVKKPDH
jgi:hypothetical protein